MLNSLAKLNLIVVLVMSLIYFYQVVYTVIGTAYRKKIPYLPGSEPHRFAALICARNESSVIGELIESLKKQNYPENMLDIYVLADNCTDDTAKKAAEAGANVYERFNTEQVGKGYALDYLLKKIDLKCTLEYYSGYFVFDADNIIDENFVAEMNKAYAKGSEVITSYRNSKNFAYNWITYGYSLWFLHEARFKNFPRALLGNSCLVSGTGFMVSSKIIRENGGWPFHLMTEDIQFSVNCAVKGVKIGYCDSAILYDEQPTTFKQSWSQRMRWAKGFYQVDAKYLPSLFKGIFTSKGKRMTLYDITMTVAPAMLFSIVFTLFNVSVAGMVFTAPKIIARIILRRTYRFLFYTLFSAYIGLLAMGILTVFTEWKRIHATAFQKLVYLPLFPLFIATYIPIAVAALVMRVEWTPIRHFSCSDKKHALSTK